jgi:hypothetical protein
MGHKTVQGIKNKQVKTPPRCQVVFLVRCLQKCLIRYLEERRTTLKVQQNSGSADFHVQAQFVGNHCYEL